MSSVRRALLLLLWSLLLAAPVQMASAQMLRKDGELVLHAYTLRHRAATDAIPIISKMLTKQGTVELQPATNTLVIRDTTEAMNKITAALKGYDVPSRPLSLEIHIVRAMRTTISGAPPQSDLPDALTQRLRDLLPYDNYQAQSQARLSSREGEAVTYALGGEYEVSFRLGTIVDGQKVRLSDFRILRRAENRRSVLIHTNLILPLEQTTSFVLARNEASREALIVVLTLRERKGSGQQRP
jgi:hypothetical protein